MAFKRSCKSCPNWGERGEGVIWTKSKRTAVFFGMSSLRVKRYVSIIQKQDSRLIRTKSFSSFYSVQNMRPLHLTICRNSFFLFIFIIIVNSKQKTWHEQTMIREFIVWVVLPLVGGPSACSMAHTWGETIIIIYVQCENMNNVHWTWTNPGNSLPEW